MKKTLAVVLFGALAVMGCDSKTANAQNPESITVGNPGSSNIMMIEEGIMVTTPAAQPNNNAATTDWSQEGNVDVAPAPNNAPVPATMPQPNNNMDSVNVNVLETMSPDSSSYQMNESVTE